MKASDGKYDCYAGVYSARHGLKCKNDSDAIKISLGLSRCRKPEDWLPDWECKPTTIAGIRECSQLEPSPMTYVAFAQVYFEVVRYCKTYNIAAVTDTISVLKVMAHNAMLGGHLTQEMAVDQIEEMARYTTTFLYEAASANYNNNNRIAVLDTAADAFGRLVDSIPGRLLGEKMRRDYKIFVRGRAAKSTVYFETAIFFAYLIASWVLIFILAKETKTIVYVKALGFNMAAFAVASVIPYVTLRHIVRIIIIGMCDVPDTEVERRWRRKGRNE